MSIRPLGHSPYPTVTGHSAGSRLLRYGVAVIAVGLATLLGFYLRPFSYTTPFLFFYPAVIVAVWIGGFKPGLLATALASVSADFFFLAPYNEISTDISNLLRTFFFGLTFASICWFADLARKHLHSLIAIQSELLEMSFEPVIVRDSEDRIIYWNQGAERLYGWSKDEALGQLSNALLQTVFPKPLDEVLVDFQKSGRWSGEVIQTKRDGNEIVVATQWTLKVESAKQVAVLEANRDITEHKVEAEALRKSEQRFRSLFENMLDGFAYCKIILDDHGRPVDFVYLEVNGAFEMLTDLKNVVGKKVTEVIPGIKESQPELLERYGRVALTGEPERFEIELKALGKWFSISAYSPAREYFVAVFDNISERKRAEQELIAAKELAEKTLAQFRANIDSMSEGMYIVGADGKRLLTNPAYFRIHDFDPGCSPDSIPTLLEHYDLNDKLIPPNDWSVARALRGETVVQRQQRARRIDTGREVIVRVNATPVRDGSGNVTMAVVTVEDITAMKQAEESLRTSEKLAAVGRMSGTLAHEINNPLDALNNLVYLLSQDSKLDEHGRECVQLLQKELERMQHIVANTLSFYRDASSPVQVNLSQVLGSVLTLDARKIDGKRLQVIKRIDATLPVMGFPGELRQVFLNLVSNAIEATPDGGKLRIHIFPSRRWQKEEVRGVRVVIADNGHGISSEQRSKLFQPFFTTKGEQGTGLGLWVSQGIVRKHQGEIRLRSTTRFGRSGTCFSVFLPMELPERKRQETTEAKLAS